MSILPLGDINTVMLQEYKNLPVLYADEFHFVVVAALGVVMASGSLPRCMRYPLIEAYRKSGAVKNIYLFINGKEIN